MSEERAEHFFVQQSPPVRRPDPIAVKNHLLANLRQSVWEATQVMDYDEIRAYVEGVLREVEADEP